MFIPSLPRRENQRISLYFYFSWPSYWIKSIEGKQLLISAHRINYFHMASKNTIYILTPPCGHYSCCSFQKNVVKLYAYMTIICFYRVKLLLLPIQWHMHIKSINMYCNRDKMNVIVLSITNSGRKVEHCLLSLGDFLHFCFSLYDFITKTYMWSPYSRCWMQKM